MAKKDQRQSRKVRGDPASDSLEVVEAFAPPVHVGEKAEIGGRAVRAVAAVVARRHDIAGVGQREREPFVASAVFGEAVRDLDAGARRALGRPAAGENRAAAAFDYAWETVTEPRRRGLENCTTSLEKLLLLVRNFVEPLPRAIPGGCPLLNTAIDSDDGNAVLREKARGALDEWRSVIVEIVCQGMRSGELRSDVDPIAVATIVISSLEGAIMFSRLEKTREALFMIGKHLESYLRSLSRPA